MLNKKVTIIIAIILFGAFLVGFYLLSQKVFNPEVVPVVQAPVAVEPKQDAPIEKDPNKIPEEIKKIMANMVFGTVEKIDSGVISVKSADGTMKELPIEIGKTIVKSRVDGEIKDMSISDVKVGMRVYVNFEKETGIATAISLLQVPIK